MARADLQDNNVRPEKWRGMTLPDEHARAIHTAWIERAGERPDPDGCFFCWAIQQAVFPAKETSQETTG